MNRLELFFGKSFIFLLAILIGIPLGILAGTISFIKKVIEYPFYIYMGTYKQWSDRITMEQADMWTRHIYRMEQNKQEQSEE